MSKYDREDPSPDRGARGEVNWRDRVRHDPPRSDERFGQTQRRDDDYSASDYRYDYRSARYSAGERDDGRRPGRHPREDRDDDSSSGHNDWGPSAAPYYGAGYSGPYASGSRDAARYPERSYAAERHPYVRGQQEQAWSRGPRTEEGYGHDYEARWPPSGSGSEAYHRPVRWRSESELGSREGQRGWSNSEGARSQGNYGKGPKGYVRSDERIREDVCDRLSDDDELDASDITVTVSNAEVRLEGSVLDRHSKHHAEDLVESVSGVRDITNNLRARKGLLREMGDKLSGEDRDDHRGHAGSGTHNSPSQSSPPQGSPVQSSTLGNKGGLSANR